MSNYPIFHLRNFVYNLFSPKRIKIVLEIAFSYFSSLLINSYLPEYETTTNLKILNLAYL